jgi:hypothetical protein
MVQRVPFMVAELGRDADPFMLHLYAALAEKEPWRTNCPPNRKFKPRFRNCNRTPKLYILRGDLISRCAAAAE